MEELKGAVVLLNSLAGDAKGPFLFWLCCHYLVSPAVFLAVFVFLVGLGKKLIQLYYVEVKFNQEICQIMSFSEGALTDYEKQEVLRALRKAKEL